MTDSSLSGFVRLPVELRASIWRAAVWARLPETPLRIAHEPRSFCHVMADRWQQKAGGALQEASSTIGRVCHEARQAVMQVLPRVAYLISNTPTTEQFDPVNSERFGYYPIYGMLRWNSAVLAATAHDCIDGGLNLVPSCFHQESCTACNTVEEYPSMALVLLEGRQHVRLVAWVDVSGLFNS
jgi:hypothetical protein